MEGIDFEQDKRTIKDILKDFSTDEVYVNGDAVIEGFKAIENFFKNLLF